MTRRGGRDRRDRAAASAPARTARCSRRRSSTRTYTCARPGARTRRTSPRARAPRRRAATAPSSPCPTPIPSSTRRRCSARSPRRREREAEVPVGSSPRSPSRQAGAELTEMVELAERGAAGFSDDGRPVVAPGLIRRALQYSAAAGRPVARPLRGADALARRPRPRGPRLGRARLRRLPVRGRERHGRARPRARRLRGAAAPSAAPLGAESVAELRRAREAGIRATAEVTPHHLCLTDDAVRSLDPNVKMNPPLRADEDRAALIEALLDGTIEAIATDHAPHAREEKEVPFEEAPFGVTGLETAFSALYTQLVEPGVVPLATLLERMSAGPGAHLRPRHAEDRGRRPGEPRPARPRRRLARGRGLLQVEVGELLAAGHDAHGRVVQTVAAGKLVFARERLSRPRGRHGLPRPLGGRARASPTARRSSRRR